MVSVIIPVYNEGKTITPCLISLSKQSYKNMEVIVVDDGSTDKTYDVLSELSIFNNQLSIYKQDHTGPAQARNLGAKLAKGEILVFVDGDMTFDKNFISKLVDPIEKGKAKGTFSKEELLLNKNNIWSLCWNINRFLINNWKLNNDVYKRILPVNYPSQQPVFRAILKKEYDKVGGFNRTGYTDDWSLSKKLEYQAQLAPGAVHYHINPDNLSEIYKQALWIGGNQIITGNLTRKTYNLLRYSFLVSLFVGLYISFRLKICQFIIFKIVYDLAVFLSILSSFFTVKTKK